MNYKATIEIQKGQLEAYELMFSYGEKELIEYEIPRLENIKTWTAKFPNGNEIDIKINASEDDVWSEGVIFDSNYNEIGHTDVCDSLEGKWVLEVGEDTYEVDVVGKEHIDLVFETELKGE